MGKKGEKEKSEKKRKNKEEKQKGNKNLEILNNNGKQKYLRIMKKNIYIYKKEKN